MTANKTSGSVISSARTTTNTKLITIMDVAIIFALKGMT